MKRFIQGEHRGQSTLLPESLDDYVSDINPVRVVEVPNPSQPQFETGLGVIRSSASHRPL